MNITELRIPGLMLVKPDVFADARGFFVESYNDERWRSYGLNFNFVQDNHSMSTEAGVLRGLHYQLNPKSQTKLVRVTTGAIYDVAVDIRKNSPTYGQWQGVILSAANKRQLLIPKGFAHGFCTLVPNTEVQYKVDTYYAPEYDRGIAWDDPILGIDWPTDQPILSAKDGRHPVLADADHNFVYEG